MANFCIPKHLVQKLKNSALKGEVDIKKLYEMSSKERRDFFTKYTDDSLGKLINTEFEKAIISKQKSALTDWAKSVFTPKAQAKKEFKTVLDKINALDEMGVLDPKTENAFLEDLVSDKLGVSVSPEEVRIIKGKAEAIQKAQETLGDNLGLITHEKETLEFFKAKKSMDDYLNSLNPSSPLKVLTSTIGRGMMLASLKSPILNIGSNTEMAIVESVVRRFSGAGFKGADNKMALDYMKMVNKVYTETGYDMSRMMSLADQGTSGQRVLGDIPTIQGKGVTRKVGRIVEDVVFKNLMGAPDVAFSSAHFADSVNLNAMKIAKGNKGKAKEIMEDAMRVTPQTPEGEILRAQGVMDAEYATYTDQTWASKVSLNIRDTLNKATGDVRLGDYTMPFVKTPANVVAVGMDYAGLGAVKALKTGIKAIKAGEITREQTQDIVRNMIRSGLGFTGAIALTSTISDDDFVGAYDPARKQIEELRNSNYNAIRIGGKWISLDWFGPLGVPMSSIMYARKYGTTTPEKIFQYGKGTVTQVAKIPGLEQIADLYKGLQADQQKKTLGESTEGTGAFLIGEASSRLMPSLLSDIAKATDTYVREAKAPLEKVQAKVPFLSKKLPVKETIFGEPIKGEGILSDILLGARVKTNKEDPVIKEIDRVAKENDKGITFTDWRTSNNKELMQFKQKYGADIYKVATKEYGQKLKTSLNELVNSDEYKNMEESEKLTAISNTDAKAQKALFTKYGFKYQRQK